MKGINSKLNDKIKFDSLVIAVRDSVVKSRSKHRVKIDRIKDKINLHNDLNYLENEL